MRRCRIAAVIVVSGAWTLWTSGLLAAAAVQHLAVPVGGPASTPVPGSPPCPGDAPTHQLSCEVGTVLTQVPQRAVGGIASTPTPAPAPHAPALSRPAAGGAIDVPHLPPPPAPPPLPALSPAAVEATAAFSNDPFLQSLLAMLAQPVDGRHDLRHFRPATASGASHHLAGLALAARPSAPDGGASGEAVTVLQALLAVLLGATAILVTLAVAGLRRHPDAGSSSEPEARAQGLRRLLLAGAIVVTAAGTGVLSWKVVPVAAIVDAMASSATRPAEPSSPTGGSDPVPSDQAGTGTPLWQQLTAVERHLADDQDRLALLDGEMRRILGTDVEPVGLDGARLRPSRVAGLVASHETIAAEDRAAQQSEYLLYRRAADDPGERRGLLEGAAPVPGALDAVNANLQLLDTQVAQERAIAQAQEILSHFGDLSPAQLQGIAHHQPFIVPETAPVTQPFGPTDFWMEPPLSYRGTFYPHFHTGIDLAAPLRTPVHAAADGVVLLAAASVDPQGHLVGYGNYVLIGHADGFATLYGHLDSVSVRTGDVVHQGQIVGLEGSTGWSTGPHLHFEIRRGTEVLDPALLLAAAPR